jgi:hypothetical protein
MLVKTRYVYGGEMITHQKVKNPNYPKEKPKMKISKPKVILASVAALALTGFTAASATSLSLQSNNELAAGTSVTASCQQVADGAITVAFSTPTWDAVSQKFTVDAVNLGNISEECENFSAKVVVADASGTQLGTQPVTLDDSGSAAFVLGSAVDSAAVGSVNVVVY